MFSRAKPKTDGAAGSAAPSILSADFTLKGDVTSEGDVQIDGKVEGDVRCARLTIGVTGFLIGQVFADYVLVRGKIEGRIRAHDVTLTRTARVAGDIVHESLMIEPGAFMEGRCERLDGVAAGGDQVLNLVTSEPPAKSG